MAQKTAIEWTDVSWNPVHGCSKVSPGCAHCYAETLSRRYGQTTKPWTPANATENVMLKPHKLREPLSKAGPWKQPCRVFVNSMSDLFHELVPDRYIAQVFGVMAKAEQHTFQVLTKRPERMRAVLQRFALGFYWRELDLGRRPVWPLPNVWLGTSIENSRFGHRADELREVPAAVRFISAEPLLGPLTTARFYEGCAAPPARPSDRLGLEGIDWLIVGGESGAGHRPIRAEWVRDLRDACQAAGTAFFFKQWGGATSKAGGRELDGRTYDEMPEVAHA